MFLTRLCAKFAPSGVKRLLPLLKGRCSTTEGERGSIKRAGCCFRLQHLSPGRDPKSWLCLPLRLLLDSARFTLFYSREILEEISDVLRRPRLRQRFSKLTDENIDNLLQQLKHHAIEVTNVPETFRYPRDPDDEVYVNLALVTNAPYLVTYDKDLLDLMVKENEEAKSFRHRFPSLKIIDPQAFLEILEA